MFANLRRSAALVLATALLTPLIAACASGSPKSDGQASTSRMVSATQGPFFPECGGASDQTLAKLTGVARLVTTARTSVGCQWVAGGSVLGPVFAFYWFRGSPIGRERKTEELHGASVNDIDIDGHKGFVAVRADTAFSHYYCDVAIQYQDDYIDWSIRVRKKPARDLCDIAKELSRQSIAVAK